MRCYRCSLKQIFTGQGKKFFIPAVLFFSVFLFADNGESPDQYYYEDTESNGIEDRWDADDLEEYEYEYPGSTTPPEYPQYPSKEPFYEQPRQPQRPQFDPERQRIN
ncbi:MAG: hypothetical protein Tsb0015_13170 [Simkaniaceae bacterium]